jgi:hypothetical protein
MQEEVKTWSPVRAAVDSYYDLQRLRIAVENRLRKLGQAEMAADVHIEELGKLLETLQSHEKLMVKNLKIEAMKSSTGLWLQEIRGIGPVLASGLMAHFDARKAQHVSSFWKYAGLYPGAKLEKGKKAPYSIGARVLCFKVGMQFLMQKNETYLPIYVEWKAKYLERFTGEKSVKLHADLAARRKMVCRFLADFWLEYRKNLGLPTNEPYAIAVLHHSKDDASMKQDLEDAKEDATNEEHVEQDS